MAASRAFRVRGALPPLRLEVVEEVEYEWSVEVGENEFRGRAAESPLGEAEEKLERLPVAGDRRRARATLGDQVPKEKLLQELRKLEGRGSHVAASPVRRA